MYIYGHTMVSFPYSTIDLTSEEIEKILSIFKTLQDKLNISFKTDFVFSFENFGLFENYLNHSIGPVIEIHNNENSFYITFTQVFYKMNTASRLPVSTTGEYQTWCVLPLKRNYGHVLIKTETILDKILELVHPIEIDFKDDLEFSKKFYVVATDELLARSLLSSQFRKSLNTLAEKDLWVEIRGNNLIVGNKKRIETSTALEMAGFIHKISGFID